VDPKITEVVEAIGSEQPPSNEALSTARASLLDLLKVAAAEETRDLEAASLYRQAIDTIDAEVAARAEAEEAEAAAAKALLEGLDDEAEDAEAPEDKTEDEQSEEKEAAPVAEPVAAANIASRLNQAMRRTQAAMTENTPHGNPNVKVEILGRTVPSDAGAFESIVEAFADRAHRFTSRGEATSLAHIKFAPLEGRGLMSATPSDNTLVLDSVIDPVVAAGGICEPIAADFNVPVLSDRTRVLKRALPGFNASRGGVRYHRALSVGDITTGVGLWTAANDEDPSSPATKAIQTIDCEQELTAYVDAITARLQIGNFQARFAPEQWRAWLQTLLIAQERLAEVTIWNKMNALSVQRTFDGGGTLQSVIGAILRSVSALRSQYRYLGTVNVAAPTWLQDALIEHATVQRPGSSPQEAYTLARGQVDAIFTTKGIRVHWSPDVQPISITGSASSTTLETFPSTVKFIAWPEGTFFHLDGGTLDLGTEIVDSTLAGTNDRQAFAEVFEGVGFRGGRSYAVTVPIDPACICPDVFTATS
jgi:hypothetical protein